MEFKLLTIVYHGIFKKSISLFANVCYYLYIGKTPASYQLICGRLQVINLFFIKYKTNLCVLLYNTLRIYTIKKLDLLLLNYKK